MNTKKYIWSWNNTLYTAEPYSLQDIIHEVINKYFYYGTDDGSNEGIEIKLLGECFHVSYTHQEGEAYFHTVNANLNAVTEFLEDLAVMADKEEDSFEISELSFKTIQTTEETTGDYLVKQFSQLNPLQWRNSIYGAFQDYKNCYETLDEETTNPWFHFIDLMASMWGFYGDLDIYIPNGMMEAKVMEMLNSHKTKQQVNSFIKQVGDARDMVDKNIEYLVNECGFQVIEV